MINEQSYNAFLQSIGCSRDEKRYIDQCIAKLQESHLYDGGNLSEVCVSAQTRINLIPFLEEYEYVKEVAKRAIYKFYWNAYRQLSNFPKGLPSEMNDILKGRSKEILEIFQAIAQTGSESEIRIVLKNNTLIRPDELKYFPTGRFSIKEFDLEAQTVQDVYIHNQEPKYFRGLMKLTLIISYLYKEYKECDDTIADGFKDLVFALYEVSQFFNACNPSKEDQLKQEEATYQLLTEEPNPKRDPEVAKAFAELLMRIDFYMNRRNKRDFSDVPRYLRDLIKALKSTYKYCHSVYSEEDYYVSLKSDSVTLPYDERLTMTVKVWNKQHTKYRREKKLCRASLIKSMVENDPFEGCEFDNVTGYVSHYNKTVLKGIKAPKVKTIHIQNPGKWKTRAIHLACSALQDRCSYIANRLAAVLKKIPSDCTFDQSNGHRFNRMVTCKENRYGRWNVLAYDWSNATDKMMQDFQEACLSIVFDNAIVRFWHDVSTCEKSFQFCNNVTKTYIQKSGQPQGLLGSFVAFAFAHHIMMLLMMQMSNMENMDPYMVYRVLGDDSLICSAGLDPHNIVGENYIRICETYNMAINRTKSTEVMADSESCLVEFAKVFVLDGEFCSPIPFKLASRIADPNRDYYAFAAYLWGQRHGMNNRYVIKSLINKYYPEEDENQIISNIIFGGDIPAYTGEGFEEFTEPLMERDVMYLKSILAYWFVNVQSSFLMPLVSDNIKDNVNLYDLLERDGLLDIIPEDFSSYYDLVEDPDHKINHVITSNLNKEDVIKQILGCQTDQAIVIAAGLNITDEDIATVRTLVELVQMCHHATDDVLEYYRSDILALASSIKTLRAFDMRSIYKRDAWSSRLLRKTVEAYRTMFG